MSDAVCILNWLFAGTAEPAAPECATGTLDGLNGDVNGQRCHSGLLETWARCSSTARQRLVMGYKVQVKAQHQQPLRGRMRALVVLLAFVSFVLTGIVLKEGILESWHIYWLRWGDEEQRKASAVFLGNAHSTRAIPYLLAIFDESDKAVPGKPWSGWRAAEALIRISPEGKNALIVKMRSIIKCNGNVPLCEAAISIVAFMKADARSAAGELRQVLECEDEGIRRMALEALKVIE